MLPSEELYLKHNGLLPYSHNDNERNFSTCANLQEDVAVLKDVLSDTDVEAVAHRNNYNGHLSDDDGEYHDDEDKFPEEQLEQFKLDFGLGGDHIVVSGPI